MSTPYSYGGPASGPYEPPASQSNGLGAAATICGGIGVLFGFVPLTFWVAGPLALAALVTGGLAVSRARRGRASKGLSYTGAGLGAAAAILSIVGAVVFFATMSQFGEDLENIGGGSSVAPSGGGGTEPAWESAPPPSAVELAIGDTATVTQNGHPAGTVTVTEVDTYQNPRQPYSQAAANGHYVAVSVTMTAADGYSFTVDPFHFVAIGPDGRRFESGGGNSFLEIPMGEMFDYTTLNPGQTVTATLHFDVPAEHGKIGYLSGGLDNSVIGTWKY